MQDQKDNIQKRSSKKAASQATTNNGAGKAAIHLEDNRPKNPVQRKLAENLQVDSKPVQKKENNTGLPDTLKSGIENLSGHSMDDVKVHYNSNKPAQLNAHAYAQGSQIHLGAGQEKHLPHEAWHVVQQKQGRVKPTTQLNGTVINDSPSLEQEADVMGSKALQRKTDVSPKDTMLETLQLKEVEPTMVQRQLALQLMADTSKVIRGQQSVQLYGNSWLQSASNYSSEDMAAIQRVAIDTYYESQNQSLSPDVAQLLESSTWDKIYETLSTAAILATMGATIATAFQDGGLGYLIPTCISAASTLILGLMSFYKKTTDEPKESRLFIISLINTFITQIGVGIIALGVSMNNQTITAISTTLTIAIMLGLDIFRSVSLERNTVYNLIYNGIAAIGNRIGGANPEAQGLIDNPV